MSWEMLPKMICSFGDTTGLALTDEGEAGRHAPNMKARFGNLLLQFVGDCSSSLIMPETFIDRMRDKSSHLIVVIPATHRRAVLLH